MGGASRTNVTRAANGARTIDANPVTRGACVGVTERGPIGTFSILNSIADYERIYGQPTTNSADTYLELKCAFDEAGKGGVTVYMCRVVHCTTPSDPTTKTSAAATLGLLTAAVAATSGSLTSGAGPFVLLHGDTLNFKTDEGGAQNFAISATAASRTSTTGTYVLADGQTLTGTINGVAFPTKVFHTAEFNTIGTATPAEVVAALNAHFAGNGVDAVASVSANAVKITSNRLGTGSGVNISGGTANAALTFTTGNVAGTGNVANVAAVTASEIATIIAGITGGTVAVVGSTWKVTSSTTGTGSSVHFLNTSSTTTKFGVDNAIHTGVAAGTLSTLTIDAKTDGAYANALSVKTAAASSGDAASFNLSVMKTGIAVEQFLNCNLDPTSVRYVETLVNNGGPGVRPSNLIKVTDLMAAAASPGNLPDLGTFGPLTGGADGLVGLADSDFTGGVSVNGRTGMRVFNVIDPGFMLIAPGRATTAVHNGMVTYCDGDRGGLCQFAADAPAGLTADQLVTYVTSTASLKNLSQGGRMHWPRVYVDNPNPTVFGLDKTILTGTSGAYLGARARVDQSKDGGQFEQAGGQSVPLTTVRGLETDEVKDDGPRGRVFDALVNPVMKKDGTPFYFDGARSLSELGPFASDGETWGCLFLQIAIGNALDPDRQKNLRRRLFTQERLAIGNFMKRLTSRHCFASDKDAEAWAFDNGRALNTAADAEARQSNARLGVAFAKPGEFINVEIFPLSISAA